ncbi:hypothetical protein AMATHDRAFT_58360 [Amanita thiersii Skay4041]|uniref:Uncharacterized protein n=1 Tax=Amanita thiersii Skay4041 TaxID=703135 RepID=A0A2A9NU64_9AGAR|nr:hypothetical protein AMATHDRAFT_58360 [Amanita thiersii Skay4041]
MTSPPHSNPNQGSYVPYSVPPYTYSMPSYYPPPGQMVAPYPNPVPPPVYDIPRSSNGPTASNYTAVNPTRPGVSNGVNTPPNGSRNLRSAPGMNGQSKVRSGPSMSSTRSPWSYGPGAGTGGYVAPQGTGSDAVGPRLSSSRRQSGNSGGSSSYSRSSSNNDDGSSTTSSSTNSSSSRRTYTSTTSSQHPLPPRPDWAVGMTPPPSMFPTHGRQHDHMHGNARPMSITNSRNSVVSGNTTIPLAPPTNQQMPRLQPTDFPPLTSNTAQDRRANSAIGAWGNSFSWSVTSPNQVPQHLSSRTMINQSNIMPNLYTYGFDDSERGFERPPPKSAELYNHKAGKRPPADGNGRHHADGEEARNDLLETANLVEQAAAMSVAGQIASADKSSSGNGNIKAGAVMT